MFVNLSVILHWDFFICFSFTEKNAQVFEPEAVEAENARAIGFIGGLFVALTASLVVAADWPYAMYLYKHKKLPTIG